MPQVVSTCKKILLIKCQQLGHAEKNKNYLFARRPPTDVCCCTFLVQDLWFVHAPLCFIHGFILSMRVFSFHHKSLLTLILSIIVILYFHMIPVSILLVLHSQEDKSFLTSWLPFLSFLTQFPVGYIISFLTVSTRVTFCTAAICLHASDGLISQGRQ